MSCQLKRCQGKRGCICTIAQKKPSLLPKRSAPIVHYPKKPAAGGTASPTKTSPAKKSVDTKKGDQSEQVVSLPPISRSNSNLSLVVPVPSPLQVPAAAEPTCHTGQCMIRYSHYKKTFPIVNGSCVNTVIDEEYFLSFAFPNSKMHISEYSPSNFTFEEKGFTERPLMREDPPGTYHGLATNTEYWVIVEEDVAEKEAYEKRSDEFAAKQAAKRDEEEERLANGGGIVTEKVEGCSCIEGNPCLDKYACKDWDNRYTVAKKFGWKGF